MSPRAGAVLHYATAANNPFVFSNVNVGLVKRRLLTSFLWCFFSFMAIGQNAIVIENAKAGNPASEWDIIGAGDQSIQGFSTQLSVNKGETVRFKIKTNASAYSIEIYRIGYYGGLGARRIGSAKITAALPQVQPNYLYDVATGKADCSNWAESATWAVPTTAVSGVYIAKLKRTDNGGSSHIIFIVRDDASNSNILYKTSDATWQAYNNFGGNSLYAFTFYNNVVPIPVPGFQQAVKLSYNRPMSTRAGNVGSGVPESFFFNAEYAMLRWLERNGYNMSYTTQLDIAKRKTAITPANHKVLLSVGHDEYWSAEERTLFENARKAGVNIAFFSGNEVSWKIRWEDDYRTLVCYKEGGEGAYSCPGKCDPNETAWTGYWRNGCQYPSADGCNPENAFTGQFGSEAVVSTSNIKVPFAHKDLRFWRNTQVASLQAGQTVTLTNGSLGYEWDFEQTSDTYPAGRVSLSNTVLDGKRHKMSLYRYPNGGLVFNAGTVNWSWGLDGIHDIAPSVEDKNIQQATINLLADMGVQPETPQSNLIVATQVIDNIPPISSIDIAYVPGAVIKGKVFNIIGTAIDAGGVVAGVEISFDGGKTWKLTNGTKNWSFAWLPTVEGDVTIISRAFDDYGNIELIDGSDKNKIRISVGPNVCPCTVFSPNDIADNTMNDGIPIEVGMKFKSVVDGYIEGMRYYKSPGQRGVVTGHLWKTTGAQTGDLLAEVIFTNESAAGWQQINFSKPVLITAGQTYVVSTYNSIGDYSFSRPYFTQEKNSSPLIGLADGADGGNGVYNYDFPQFPAYPYKTYVQSNYWVDVVFNPKAILIGQQPASISICNNTPAIFITSAGSSTPMTVKWQYSINGSIWNDIPGAESSTLTFNATSADNGKLFRAVWTNSEGSVPTQVATLSVNSLKATATTSSQSCSKGSINVIVTEGMAPFEYSLNNVDFQKSNVFYDLPAGTYSVMVRDAKGCSITISGLSVIPVSTLAIELQSKTDENCSGRDGSLVVKATGGVEPYSYSINGAPFQGNFIFNGLTAGNYSVAVKDANSCISVISGITIGMLYDLSVSLTNKTDASCNSSNGKISVTAACGVAPYYYILSNGTTQTNGNFTGLSAGSYCVWVMDAKWNVEKISGIDIEEVSTLTLKVSSVTNATCDNLDGAITVSASGGKGPYLYKINSGGYQSSATFSKLDDGTYQVTVKDANGCTRTLNVVLASTTSTLALSVSKVVNENCNGSDGSISVIATGGNGGYKYSLDGGSYQSSSTFSKLKSGFYTIKVRDSKGCTISQNQVEVLSIPFLVTLDKTMDVSCQGNDGSIILKISGGTAPFLYSVNGASYSSDTKVLNKLAPGTYTVKVREDNYCTSTVTGIVVKKAATLDLTILSKSDACTNTNNGSIAVEAAGGIPPYQYSLNGGSYKTSGLFTNLASGTFYVTVKDAKGCTDKISNINITRTSAACATKRSSEPRQKDKKLVDEKVEKQVSEPGITLYPNPARDQFILVLKGMEGQKVSISVTNVVGKQILQKQTLVTSNNFNQPFGLDRVAKGVYFVQVKSGIDVVTARLVVQ